VKRAEFGIRGTLRFVSNFVLRAWSFACQHGLVRRRWKILFLAAGGFIAVIAVWFFCLREKEPSYKGRRLSEWLERHATGWKYDDSMRRVGEDKDSADAILAIGTSALPWLLKWNSEKTPTINVMWQRFVELPDGYKPTVVRKALIRASEEIKHQLAVEGFEVLGTNAASALPELQMAFRNATNTSDISRCAECMKFLGVGALEFFITVIREDGTNFHRTCAIRYIGDMGYLGTNALPAVPVLLAAAKRPNSWGAARSVGQLQLQPEIVIPALTNLLTSTNYCERMFSLLGLGFIGKNGSVPRASLQTALTDPVSAVRTTATNIVEVIAPDLLADDIEYVRKQKRLGARYAIPDANF
jgi:hypothetical protein